MLIPAVPGHMPALCWTKTHEAILGVHKIVYTKVYTAGYRHGARLWRGRRQTLPLPSSVSVFHLSRSLFFFFFSLVSCLFVLLLLDKHKH